MFYKEIRFWNFLKQYECESLVVCLFVLFLTGVTHWSVKTCSERGSSIKGPEEYVSYNIATYNISSTVTSTHRETAYIIQPFGWLKQTLSKKQQDLDSVLAISTIESVID